MLFILVKDYWNKNLENLRTDNWQIWKVSGIYPKVFSKGIFFPSENLPRGNFPNVQFFKLQLPKGYVKGYRGRALRLGKTWEAVVGKLHILENALGKYLTSN